jgi:vacuolar-type H+-ATPase catalytic subunit A/Vma1
MLKLIMDVYDMAKGIIEKGVKVSKIAEQPFNEGVARLRYSQDIKKDEKKVRDDAKAQLSKLTGSSLGD